MPNSLPSSPVSSPELPSPPVPAIRADRAEVRALRMRRIESELHGLRQKLASLEAGPVAPDLAGDSFHVAQGGPHTPPLAAAPTPPLLASPGAPAPDLEPVAPASVAQLLKMAAVGTAAALLGAHAGSALLGTLPASAAIAAWFVASNMGAGSAAAPNDFAQAWTPSKAASFARSSFTTGMAVALCPALLGVSAGGLSVAGALCVGPMVLGRVLPLALATAAPQTMRAVAAHAIGAPFASAITMGSGALLVGWLAGVVASPVAALAYVVTMATISNAQFSAYALLGRDPAPSQVQHQADLGIAAIASGATLVTPWALASLGLTGARLGLFQLSQAFGAMSLYLATQRTDGEQAVAAAAVE